MSTRSPRQTSNHESEARRHDRIALAAKTRQEVLGTIRNPRIQDATLRLSEEVSERVHRITEHVESCISCGSVGGHRRDCRFLDPSFDL